MSKARTSGPLKYSKIHFSLPKFLDIVFGEVAFISFTKQTLVQHSPGDLRRGSDTWSVRMIHFSRYKSFDHFQSREMTLGLFCSPPGAQVSLVASGH